MKLVLIVNLVKSIKPYLLYSPLFDAYNMRRHFCQKSPTLENCQKIVRDKYVSVVLKLRRAFKMHQKNRLNFNNMKSMLSRENYFCHFLTSQI